MSSVRRKSNHSLSELPQKSVQINTTSYKKCLSFQYIYHVHDYLIENLQLEVGIKIKVLNF